MARTLQLSDIFAKSVQILEIGFWQSFKKHTMKGQWHGVKHNKQQGRHSFLCCWDLVQKLNFDHQTGILRQIFRNVYCCKTKISLPKCLLFLILFFQECRQILWRSSLLFWEPLPRPVCSTSKRLTGHFAILLPCVTVVIAFFPSSGVDQRLLSCFRKKVLSLAVSATGSGKLEEISQAFVEVSWQS